MALLRPYLPEDYCIQAAQLILENPGNVLITTGFYIDAVRMPETDGPPGALAIGCALKTLGFNVNYITDHFSAALLKEFCIQGEEVFEFPVTGMIESKNFTTKVFESYRPDLLVSVERCGMDQNGLYTNWKGRDISVFNAKIDYLFMNGTPSIGVGDGGNEIGMGNLAQIIPTLDGLPLNPCVTKTTALIPAGVSNWGAYGLVAALSKLTHRNLLPLIQSEIDLITQMAAVGACDGVLLTKSASVDGFSLDENIQILELLNQWVIQNI